MKTRRRQKRDQAKRFNQQVDPGYKPVTLTARTPNQKTYIRSIHENDITFCTGPAGTGKTHVAVGLAVQMVRQGFLNRIIFTRPLVSVGKDMGYLPGDINDKVGPYIQPCFDELHYYLSFALIKSWMVDGKIEIVPLSMMRGRTLNNAFVILDEAQNASYSELKTLLTRIGEPSRLVLAGDLYQSDLISELQGAFSEALNRLTSIQGIEHVELTAHDIVRHPLLRDIIDQLW